MTHYTDIRILSLPEIAPEHILEKLYSKIHLALAELKRSDIGLSFPDVNEKRPSLGQRLRLHSSEQVLRCLLDKIGLAAMRDYLRPGEILPTPEQTAFRQVLRVQIQSSADRMRRRFAKRHNLSMDEAAARIPDSVAGKLKLPFIRMQSKSSGQTFNLFISHGTIRQTPIPGEFNAYGLSTEATIPWF